MVVISDAYLDDVWLSRHHIPVELARRHRVLFVERPPNVVKPSTWRRWWPRQRLREGPHGMWIYSPYPRFPFDHRWLWVSRFNQRWLAWQLRRLVRQLGLVDPALISFDHKAAGIMAKWGGGPKVYYCVDDIAEFAWPFARRETVEADERATVQAADLTVVTADRLKAKLHAFARRIETLPHGVQVDWWQTPLKKAGNRPRAVFIGKIADWVDTRLVGEVARLLPHWDVVMIGPVETKSPLPRASNLHWRGAVPQAQLAGELCEGDVGMVPFVVSKLTESVLPLKFYEYLAAGLGVVATPLPELQKQGAWVQCVAGSTAFAEALEHAREGDGPQLRNLRQAYAAEQSWEARSRRLEGWICGS